MAEFLIKVTSKNWMDDTSKWATKGVTQEMYDKRSEKGDIVQVLLDGNRYWFNDPPQYVLLRVPELDYQKTKSTFEGGVYEETVEIVDTERTILKEVWNTMQQNDDYSPFIFKPTDITEEWTNKGNILIDRVVLKGKIEVPKQKLRKKRKYHVPSSLVDEIIVKKGDMILTLAEFEKYLSLRTLDVNNILVSNIVEAKTLDTLKMVAIDG